MKLEKLALINYKNLESNDFEFDAKINCLVGPNGVGKSNVLDAIYHLSFGKSYFNPITSQNIRHGTDFFVLDATYQKNELEERVILSVKKGQKKNIKRNGKLYGRSEHDVHERQLPPAPHSGRACSERGHEHLSFHT